MSNFKNDGEVQFEPQGRKAAAVTGPAFNKASVGRPADFIAISLIALTWLIFFWRIIFGGQVYFLDDLKILYYPIEAAYSQFQSQWQLPVWSPLFGFGQPLLAWGQLGFFTPVHLVLRLFQLHPVTLLNASIAIYSAVGLIGTYVFLRRHKLSSLASSLGAIVFGFCGFTIGHLNHVNFYTATMLLPWLLFATYSLIQKPTLPRTAALALIAAAIPISGQPQVSLYTFITAGIWGLVLLISQRKKLLTTNYSLQTISFTILAGVLAFSLASFSILPLKEFLPSTDRSGDLPIIELYEFSYPPSHAITLLSPYYFGNHDLYRGAKNFQELAAYVGIVPLLLALLALFTWRNFIALRITALVLIVIAILFTPGIYSPIYRYLVENHILTSLAVPGRFVYFFDVGVAILAALGLEPIVKSSQQFARMGFRNPRRYGLSRQALDSGEDETKRGPLAGRDDAALRAKWWMLFPLSLVLLTAANLIWWGWDYNPMVSRESALAESPLADTLQQYQKTHGVPPRLYASENIPLAGIGAVASEPTEPIGPNFTIHQPLRIRENVACLSLPFMVTNEYPDGEVTLFLSDLLQAQPFFSAQISSQNIRDRSLQKFCIEELRSRSGQDVILTLRSSEPSNLQTFQRLPQGAELGASYVRVENPTPQQLEQSRKIAHLVVTQDQPIHTDLEKNLLLRHIQATAGTSAARWIGALGIDNFRSFIDAFFANDHDPIDGEGIHALTRHQNLVNMSGITHLAQALPDHEADRDPVLAAGYPLATETTIGTTRFRLYENPKAFPKAFLVGTAIWESGPDQTRHALSSPEYEGERLIFISGPTPPETGTIPNAETPEALNMRRFPRTAFDTGTANITRYESTQVDINVKTSEPAWLVLTDSYTPQWHTFIDNVEARQYIANTVFRAAQVPAGSHTVSFRYISQAIAQAKILTLAGLIVTALILALPLLQLRHSPRK